MTETEAAEWFREGLNRYFARERNLMLHVGERALTARLLVHLDSSLHDMRKDLVDAEWVVDTEYNRIGSVAHSKVLPHLHDNLRAIASAVGLPERLLLKRATKRVNPDPILHQRQSGPASGNAVVCEVKRVGELIDALAADVGKLVTFRSDLQYQSAFLLVLGETLDTTTLRTVPGDLRSGIGLVRELIAERQSAR